MIAANGVRLPVKKTSKLYIGSRYGLFVGGEEVERRSGGQEPSSVDP